MKEEMFVNLVKELNEPEAHTLLQILEATTESDIFKIAGHLSKNSCRKILEVLNAGHEVSMHKKRTVVL